MNLSGILILLVIFYLLSDSVDGAPVSCRSRGGRLARQRLCTKVGSKYHCTIRVVCIIFLKATTTAATTEAATEATTAVTEAAIEDMTTEAMTK